MPKTIKQLKSRKNRRTQKKFRKNRKTQKKFRKMRKNQKKVRKTQRGGIIDLDLTNWTRMATQGDADAQFNLGLMYYKGEPTLGVEQNLSLAARWWWRAANKGHAKAQYNLGLMYHYGQGVEKDEEEAARWFRLAAPH